MDRDVSSSHQPQWFSADLVRPYHYSHTQPQWCDVQVDLSTPQQPTEPLQAPHSTSAVPATVPHACRGDITCDSAGSVSGSPSSPSVPQVVRRVPLPPNRTCVTCSVVKEACVCKQCAICKCNVGRGSRHHCRSCWRAVCGDCFTKKRHVHPRGAPLRVCDQCAVPWALANLCKREERGLFWGLYLLRRAGEMPCMCVMPTCLTFTYRARCYVCGVPTVMTQPHVERLLRADTANIFEVDQVRFLDGQQMSLRAAAVGAYTELDVESTFRNCFHNYEEVMAFRGVSNAQTAQDMLLSVVASAISYEYHSAPNLTLALSDVPYAKLLRVVVAKPRYTILAGPGKVKFVSFPGTHNWRTVMSDFHFAQTTKTVWVPLVVGMTLSKSGRPIPIHGGVRKMCEYGVHSGFSQEAEATGVPIEALLADVRQGYRLVLSGHSLGGAVAQFVTLQLLSKSPELFTAPPIRSSGGPCAGESAPRILCVTYGSPLLGNYQLVNRIVECGWGRYFHSFVYGSDIVPRLSCADEMTSDILSRMSKLVSSVYGNVRNWFTWRSAGAATQPEAAASGSVVEDDDDTATPSPLPALSAGAGGVMAALKAAGASVVGAEVKQKTAAEEDSELVNFVDESIRVCKDVLVDDGYDGGSGGEAGARRSDDGTATNVAEKQGEVQRLLAESSHRRLHRRFACFGRYHFLSFGDARYVSTDDSETAFGLLKHGCGQPTLLHDHSVSSYNRGMMLHLYRSHDE